MRNLIILRGPRSSGRKAFIHAQGLSPWLVDEQLLEGVFSEPVTNPRGGYRADPHQRSAIRLRVLSMLEEKMARGALIIFQPADTGAPYARKTISASDRMISQVIELARSHRYKTDIIDFSSSFTAEDLEARRKAEGFPCKPGEMDRLLSHMRRRTGLASGDDICWHDALKVGDLNALIEPEIINLDRWQNVVAIGDIHGCHATFSKLTDGFQVRPDTCYIFLGDVISKGPHSGPVMRTLLDRFMPHENCLFLTGNHEKPLDDWSRGAHIAKKAFVTTSLPSFASEGITQDDAREFLRRTIDVAYMSWRELRILATHGGFARPPEFLSRISTEHFQFGTDGARFDADGAWEENVLNESIPGPEEMIQVHGHRNPKELPIAAGTGSFNLECGVDRGGPLRALALSPGTSRDTYDARGICIQNADIHRRR